MSGTSARLDIRCFGWLLFTSPQYDLFVRRPDFLNESRQTTFLGCSLILTGWTFYRLSLSTFFFLYFISASHFFQLSLSCVIIWIFKGFFFFRYNSLRKAGVVHYFFPHYFYFTLLRCALFTVPFEIRWEQEFVYPKVKLLLFSVFKGFVSMYFG